MLFFYVPHGTVPYEMELILRHRGVKILGRKLPDENGRAGIGVAAGQKSWAEEIMFIQNGYTPAMVDSDLEPATVRRMATRAPYELRRKFGGKAVKAGGFVEGALDTLSKVDGPNDVRRDPNANRRRDNHAIE